MLTLLNGDALAMLRSLPAGSVDCCVTSPPYWGLRDYGVAGQIGQEASPEEFVTKLVAVFAEVRRVLKDDGTCWLNIGDSYAGNNGSGAVSQGHKQLTNSGSLTDAARRPRKFGMKPKDLVGIPWMVAFGLRAEGWYLRSDIIWAKRNCMPESVTDRPTRAHEYLFLLSKSPNYFYDHEAIKEPSIYDVDGTGTASRKARASELLKSHPTKERAGIRAAGFKDAAKMNGKHANKGRGHSKKHSGFTGKWDEMPKAEQCVGMRNKRSVWSVAPANYPEAHFATYPPDLIKPCILAGCPLGGVVLDPFGGSGTTGMVAIELGRKAILIELNPAYLPLIERRCATTPGLSL